VVHVLVFYVLYLCFSCYLFSIIKDDDDDDDDDIWACSYSLVGLGRTWCGQSFRLQPAKMNSQ